MASLLLFACLAMALPFAGVVILSTTLVAICQPKRRFASVLCFIIPAGVVPLALFAWGVSTSVLRYSPQGPILWLAVWPALLFAGIGITAAGFSVGPIRKRLRRSSRDGVATRAI